MTFNRQSMFEPAASTSLFILSITRRTCSDMDCLLKVIVWLRDQRDAEEFDRIYRGYFTSRETLPARTRIQAGRTPMDCGLEVEAIGFVPKKSKAHRRSRPRRK